MTANPLDVAPMVAVPLSPGSATGLIGCVHSGTDVPSSDERSSGATAATLTTQGIEERDHVAELVRTNDPGLLSVIECLLAEAQIPHHVADRDMSVLEGSILVIQQRVQVPDEREAEARALLVDAGLGEWLRH